MKKQTVIIVQGNDAAREDALWELHICSSENIIDNIIIIIIIISIWVFFHDH